MPPQTRVAGLLEPLPRHPITTAKENRMTATDPDKCPTGCGRKIRYGKLMCGPCWHQVPADLQRQVVLTWRKHLKLIRGERTMDQVRVSRAAYEHAKEAAIASVA